MKLFVTGRHVAVTDALRRDIDRKLERLVRMLGDGVVSAQCVVARERGQFVFELTLHARGDHILHGLGRHQSLPTAVTGAVEKVSQQARKLSDRWKSRRKAGRSEPAASAPGAAALAATDGAGDAEPPVARVIRSRKAAVRPMSLDDAVLALSTGDRPFFVFRHDVSNAIAVLYRRPDGHFGLIEPEA